VEHACRTGWLIVLVAFLSFHGTATATYLIKDQDIVATTGSEIHSGNGLLDLILFGFAGGGGVNENAYSDASISFDGDDANTDMPTGGGGGAVAESYITSMGEIRDFYIVNFPDGQGGSLEDELAIFVDLNETGQVNHITLGKLAVVVDFDEFPAPDTRNEPDKHDIESAVQNSTGSADRGGTVLSKLDPTIVPKVLPLNVQGAGFADYGILTGINPFDESYSDSTRAQFVWESSDHDDGGDKVFLSGSVRSQDVPEPATMALLLLGGGLLTARTLRRRMDG